MYAESSLNSWQNTNLITADKFTAFSVYILLVYYVLMVVIFALFYVCSQSCFVFYELQLHMFSFESLLALFIPLFSFNYFLQHFPQGCFIRSEVSKAVGVMETLSFSFHCCRQFHLIQQSRFSDIDLEFRMQCSALSCISIFPLRSQLIFWFLFLSIQLLFSCFVFFPSYIFECFLFVQCVLYHWKFIFWSCTFGVLCAYIYIYIFFSQFGKVTFYYVEDMIYAIVLGFYFYIYLHNLKFCCILFCEFKIERIHKHEYKL